MILKSNQSHIKPTYSNKLQSSKLDILLSNQHSNRSCNSNKQSRNNLKSSIQNSITLKKIGYTYNNDQEMTININKYRQNISKKTNIIDNILLKKSKNNLKLHIETNKCNILQRLQTRSIEKSTKNNQFINIQYKPITERYNFLKKHKHSQCQSISALSPVNSKINNVSLKLSNIFNKQKSQDKLKLKNSNHTLGNSFIFDEELNLVIENRPLKIEDFQKIKQKRTQSLNKTNEVKKEIKVKEKSITNKTQYNFNNLKKLNNHKLTIEKLQLNSKKASSNLNLASNKSSLLSKNYLIASNLNITAHTTSTNDNTSKTNSNIMPNSKATRNHLVKFNNEAMILNTFTKQTNKIKKDKNSIFDINKLIKNTFDCKIQTMQTMTKSTSNTKVIGKNDHKANKNK